MALQVFVPSRADQWTFLGGQALGQGLGMGLSSFGQGLGKYFGNERKRKDEADMLKKWAEVRRSLMYQPGQDVDPSINGEPTEMPGGSVGPSPGSTTNPAANPLFGDLTDYASPTAPDDRAYPVGPSREEARDYPVQGPPLWNRAPSFYNFAVPQPKGEMPAFADAFNVPPAATPVSPFLSTDVAPKTKKARPVKPDSVDSMFWNGLDDSERTLLLDAIMRHQR